MKKARVFLSGGCGAFEDQGYGWRKIIADAIERASNGTVGCWWPHGLEETYGSATAIARLTEQYDEDPYIFIRGDVDALLSSEVVLFTLDGNEGVGTYGEIAMARWADKPTVISRKKPTDRPQEKPILPPRTQELVNASPDLVASFVVRAVRAAVLRKERIWK